MLRRIARGRGFNFKFDDRKGTVPFARFVLSLREKPAVLSSGAVFFVSMPSFSIVLEHNGKFVKFCAYFKCFDFAEATLFDLALCHFPEKQGNGKFTKKKTLAGQPSENLSEILATYKHAHFLLFYSSYTIWNVCYFGAHEQ